MEKIEEKKYKTTGAQRRAMNKYIEKNKDNEDFKDKQRIAVRKYYDENKEAEKERVRLWRLKKKLEKISA
jgi:hypothetical protein